MKKKLLLRGLLGFPLGIALSYLITIMISLTVGDGVFYPCVPELVTQMGDELSAVVFQAVLSGILGTGCAIGSVVFEMEDWSITRMTVIHFLILSVSMLPIAYFTHWMEHSLFGILSYFGIFVAIYVVIWIIQRISWKMRLNAINQRLSQNE